MISNLVGDYRVLETATIRTQDVRRFQVSKKGRQGHYVVSFQRGCKSGCSCPAGRSQKACKHVQMCKILAS